MGSIWISSSKLYKFPMSSFAILKPSLAEFRILSKCLLFLCFFHQKSNQGCISFPRGFKELGIFNFFLQETQFFRRSSFELKVFRDITIYWNLTISKHKLSVILKEICSNRMVKYVRDFFFFIINIFISEILHVSRNIYSTY